MNVRLRIGRISIVIQIAAPFMPSVYEQTKNTKSLLVCKWQFLFFDRKRLGPKELLWKQH